MCGYKKFRNPKGNCLNFVYQYKQLAIPCMYAHEPTFIDKTLEYVKCSYLENNKYCFMDENM